MLITLCVLGALIYGRKMARFVRSSFRDAAVNKRILDTLNEVAIVTFTDKNGVITEVNDNFCRISGFERKELVGKTHRVVNSGAHDSAFFQEMWSAIASGKSWTADIENRKKTGEHYFVRTVISPILDQDGRPDRYLAIRFDISDQKKAEQSLDAERVKSLRNAKFASLGEMCAGVAHEINNPLGIISGTADLLPKFIDNKDKLRSRVATIQDACERIAKIVKSLRKFSRSDEKAERAICSISDVVDDAIVLTNAKAKRHSTVVTFKSTSVQNIWCDEIEIEQVLVNLINNGIDAVKNQVERWLLISSFDDGAAVVLRVIDSGPGLSKESQLRLFQPFFTTKPVGHGTGLGLSIARGILEDHKATIELVQGEPNTCFEIRFPVAEEQKIAV